MPEYKCVCCNYFTKIKTQYLRHLKSQKHQRLSHQDTPKAEKNDKIYQNLHNFPHFSTFSPHFSTFSPHFYDKNELKSAHLECRFCKKSFSRSDSLQRHLRDNCREVEKFQEKERQYDDLLRLLEKEREDHREQLGMVLEKVGNTTINNQTNHLTQNNTVQINNYGSENLDMLTDKFMKKMISFPYTAIPKMIKKIHFNDNYPENMNIRMLNKRDGKLQILKQNKWTYVDKKEHLSQLIDEKNYLLDQYYEDNKSNLNHSLIDRFNKYQVNLNENDTDTTIRRENNKETELVFWNSM